MKHNKDNSIATKLTTLGRHPWDHQGLVNPPIYHASTILFPTLDAFEASEHADAPLVYARSGTPASRNLEAALAELDGADHAVITSSGLAAIVVALLGVLSAGDHMLAPDSIYGSMRKFCDKDLKRLGVEVTYYDPHVGSDIEALMRPNTKMVYCESPGSLTFEVQDIPAIAKVAHAHGAVVVADNTWATPLYLRASDLGVDITIHSCTKYIGGHSDLIMGLITCGKAHYPAMRRMFRNLGCCLGSQELYLAARGMRTLATRLRQHQETGLKLAEWFRARPEVMEVLHPGLKGASGHDLWTRDFKGATGLFSVLLKSYPRDRLAAMLDHMELFGMGFSWGGYESLMIPFTPYRTASPAWIHSGICLRVHAGLEDATDLIRDLEVGFARLNGGAA